MLPDVKAIPMVQTTLPVLADDDISWPRIRYPFRLASFEGPRFGAAGAFQRVKMHQNQSSPRAILSLASVPHIMNSVPLDYRQQIILTAAALARLEERMGFGPRSDSIMIWCWHIQQKSWRSYDLTAINHEDLIICWHFAQSWTMIGKKVFTCNPCGRMLQSLGSGRKSWGIFSRAIEWCQRYDWTRNSSMIHEWLYLKNYAPHVLLIIPPYFCW